MITTGIRLLSKVLILVLAIILPAGKATSQSLSIMPDTAVQGYSVSLTFTDALMQFGVASPCTTVPASNVEFTKGPTTLRPYAFNIVNPSTANAMLNVPGSVPTGLYDVTVTGCPISCTNCFRIDTNEVLHRPQVNVSPATAQQTENLTVTFTDPKSLFASGSPCAGVTASDVEFTDGTTSFMPSTFNIQSSSQATADISVPAGAGLGAYNIIFSGGCELACDRCFTVTTGGPDLAINGSCLSLGPIERNTVVTYELNYFNNGTDTMHNPYVYMIFPAYLEYVSSSMAYSSYSNDTVKWDFTKLNPGSSGTISIDVQVVDVIAAYGQTQQVNFEIWPQAGDLTPANNNATVTKLIAHPDLYVIPNQAQTTQMLTVKFTGSATGFKQATNCTNTNQMNFTHTNTSFNFSAISSVFNAAQDTADVTIGVPSNAPLGMYDVQFCNIDCDECFEVVPNFSLAGENLGVFLSQLTPSKRLTAPKHHIFYQNKGTDTVNATITLEYSSGLSYQSSIPAHTSTSGSSVNWIINDILPGGTGSIEVQYMTLNSPIGDSLLTSVKIEPLAGDLDPMDNQDTLVQVVVSSYDPNDKLAQPEVFIPIETDVLFYQVRFQNTGNAPADKVVIVDTISSMLDFATIQTISASHGYYVETEPNNVIKWIFDNINLPDSGADWAGSQGFVKYRIQPLPGWEIRDSVLNNADIYFDNNPPVRTNTTRQYVFDCDSLANYRFETPDTICTGGYAGATYTGFGAENLIWTLSGLFIDSLPEFNSIIDEAGSFTLVLKAENWYCSQEKSNDLVVNEAEKPEVTVDGSILRSDLKDGLQWFKNGTSLVNSNSDTLKVVENGWYQVSHTNQLGCTSYSDSVEVILISVAEHSALQEVTIYPNPANNKVWITLKSPEHLLVNCSVYTFTGKLLRTDQLNFSTYPLTKEYDLGELQQGIYFITLTGQNFSETIRVLIVK